MNSIVVLSSHLLKIINANQNIGKNLMNKNLISKIEISIPGSNLQCVRMTVEQARALYDELKSLFESKSLQVFPNYPIPRDRKILEDNLPKPITPRIWCCGGAPTIDVTYSSSTPTKL